jgi:iron complex transport system ATP-binding protein
MGRYPHLGAWEPESDDDRAAIAWALERCGLAGFEDRPMRSLSGGERQRARVARALAQRPTAFALDEPTASLDVHHEMTLFGLFRDLADEGSTVLLTTHNLNLAARFADRILLLDAGRVIAHGPPADVITEPTVAATWRWPARVVAHPGPGRDTGAPQVVPLAPPIHSRTDA